MPTLDKFMKVRMTDHEHAFLSRAAKAQGTSLSAFIRDAVDREARAIVAELDRSERQVHVDTYAGVTTTSAS